MGRQSQTKGLKRCIKEEKIEGKRSSTGGGKIGRGWNSTVFWQRAKRISSKAPKRLKDKSGKVNDSEEAMAEIACEHLEGMGRGCMNEGKGEIINREMTKRDQNVDKG